jgi:Flp pilus assembly protein CpaB
VLPSGRAVVGGLLLALSGLGTLLAWHQAAAGPTASYVVTRRAIAPGERLTAGDLRTVAVDLSPTLARGAFGDSDSVVGHVTLGPLGEGELLQVGQVSADGSPGPQVEVSFALPSDRALDGRLRPGDRVDMFATFDDTTVEVAGGLEILGVSGAPTPGGGAEQTITVALAASTARTDVVHAVRAGEVTLVRSTLSAEAAG